MPTTLALVHSPLVGPLTWQAVAGILRDGGHQVVTPSLVGVVDAGPPYHQRLAERAATAIDAAVGPDGDGPVVLVAHSGAGALLPAVAAATTAPVAAAVFVDALLPHQGRSWFDTAPAPLRETLDSMADGGRLPPWNQWFPGAVEALLTDEAMRARFLAELPSLPLAYFAETAPTSAGWPPAACGYIRLSAPYDGAAAEAERLGWAVVREDADHLAMLTRPELVADLVDRMARQLTTATTT